MRHTVPHASSAVTPVRRKQSVYIGWSRGPENNEAGWARALERRSGSEKPGEALPLDPGFVAFRGQGLGSHQGESRRAPVKGPAARVTCAPWLRELVTGRCRAHWSTARFTPGGGP